MANFLLIIDPDPARRQAAAQQAQGRAAFLPQLAAEVSFGENYAIAWAIGPDAPFTKTIPRNANEAAAFLFGEPHDSSGRVVNASELRQRRQLEWTRWEQLDGFYASIHIHPERGVRVEGDVLGMFPLYHWTGDGVLLVSSSPALFKCHPLFSGSLDLHGLAGLLLTSGIVGGRTLWRGVRRLPADHLLLWSHDGKLQEKPPPSFVHEPSLATVDDAVAEVAEFHRSFLRAGLSQSKRPGLQLSGGLDSRVLAGLATQLGHQPNCLTFGRPGDLDAYCATQVAAQLKVPQTLLDVKPSDYVAYAESSVNAELLSGGVYAVPMGWNVAHHATGHRPDRVVCGLTLDAVIGGPKAVAHAADRLSFDDLRIGRLGFERKRLDALVREPGLRRACDDVRSELVETYRGAGTADHLREWRMNLAHRHRFAVGACAWRYALFAWPVMPALDRRLIKLAASLPHSVVQQRQIQTRMLTSRFPELARLDLDRNYFDTIPLLGARKSLAYNVRRRVVKLYRRAKVWSGHDPRFYLRVMDFNGPGWRSIRLEADRYRSGLHPLFNPQVLDQLIPPAKATLQPEGDPVIHSTPYKNTVGLMLWMRQQV